MPEPTDFNVAALDAALNWVAAEAAKDPGVSCWNQRYWAVRVSHEKDTPGNLGGTVARLHA